jgi:hypothetical protein
MGKSKSKTKNNKNSKKTDKTSRKTNGNQKAQGAKSLKAAMPAGKQDRRAETSATAEIAQAEKGLAKTLSKLEAVREELAEREATLRRLLIKHGRMPEQHVETAHAFEAHGRTPIEEFFGTNGQEDQPQVEPLFDQQQVVSRSGGDSGDQGQHR